MLIASVKGKFNWSAQIYTAIDSGWCLKKLTAVITGFSALGYQMPSETKIQFCHFDMYTNLFTSETEMNEGPFKFEWIFGVF